MKYKLYNFLKYEPISIFLVPSEPKSVGYICTQTPVRVVRAKLQNHQKISANHRFVLDTGRQQSDPTVIDIQEQDRVLPNLEALECPF